MGVYFCPVVRDPSGGNVVPPTHDASAERPLVYVRPRMIGGAVVGKRSAFFVLPRWLSSSGLHVYRRGNLFMVIRRPRWGFTRWEGWFTLPEVWRVDLHDLFVKEVCSVLKRSAVANVEGASVGIADGGEFSLLYPTLWEHLTQSVWDDGTPRKPSSITIFSDGPVMKCVLKDKEAALCLWLACPSMDGLFVLAEAALNDPATVWRLDRVDGQGTAKRVRPAR